VRPQQYKQIVRWFKGYAGAFAGENADDNYAYQLKEVHTYRVCANIALLSRRLNLTLGDTLLARTSALLHDVGRFNQYRRYKTFNDRNSCDHAELGIAALSSHDVLSICPAAERKLIRDAVRYHNAAVLAPDRSERVLFFTRLLRDADKLDIWKVFCDHYRECRLHPDRDPNRTIVLELPDRPECSQAVLTALQQGHFARTEDLRTIIDFKLLQISWVYDLNFRPAFELLRRREYLERIAAELPRTAEVGKAVRSAMAYAEARAGQ